MQIKKISVQPYNSKEQPQGVSLNKNQTPSFGNGVDLFLNFLDTQQAVGACVVDLGSMVIPRSTVDFINRGPSAGAETARREAMGTTNHATVGVDGLLVGSALALGLNSKYGIKAHKIFADDATISFVTKSWHNALHDSGAEDPLRKHVDTFVDNIKTFNPSAEWAQDGYASIKEADKLEIKDFLYRKLKSANGKALSKKECEALFAMITAATGGEKEAILDAKAVGERVNAVDNLKNMISNFSKITEACQSEKVKEAFMNTAEFGKNEVVKSLKHLNLRRTIGGLAIATTIGMSTQPVNMYLTKKKTGQDGFPADPDRKKDRSVGFKILKTLTGLAFATGALATITNKPSKFLSKIQFQGWLPTIDQLKLVYGLTITSRLFVARDKDELRESLVKDTLGFLNLLILGSLVTKGVARAFDKTLINKGKNFLSSSLKTRAEVLMPAMKKYGKSLLKADGSPLKFNEMLKLLKELPEQEQKILKKQLGALNWSQFIGYLYSGVVLGVGIPKLNIYMTNKAAARRERERLADADSQNQDIEKTTKDNDPNFSSNSKRLSFEDKQFIIK